jgi:hypothetical protein
VWNVGDVLRRWDRRQIEVLADGARTGEWGMNDRLSWPLKSELIEIDGKNICS